ncbi:inositol phosphatidylinositol phosphatase [Coniophora puteana RWD-64-598 SS2]|uniref:Inositol phosphatidylinositol phosphatase n=1 Tax=Coniophora puteana (strain RWD-64-598) TaxID=741705 RepID=A0A5M3N4Q0_CONPW|nr:inositol phosphatidylinositol phosphatase [Coniophora puteana RWD-64-598 SS2]EIW86399.1 inositol phosphatidylinositol phosphatase [Coniophora puteana RWD-64-598 SS2]
MKPIYTRLSLFVNRESYTFVPVEPLGAQSLTLDRTTGDIVLNATHTSVPNTSTRYGKTVYGILGLIQLALSEYVVIMTGREQRGRLMGHDVYRAVEFDILPLNPNVSIQNPPHPIEGHLLALVKSHLNGGHFLFSYSWDLSRRLQVQWEQKDAEETKALWEVADDRFFWNKFLQSRLIESEIAQELSAYILPIIYGTFDLRLADVRGRRVQLCLISRRSRFRAGTRYFRRGIDHEGHVANFNETEQLLLVEGSGQVSNDNFSDKLSFVQIRGSVPVFWGEINTMRYKPDLQVMDLETTVEAMRLHFKDQISNYGEQSLVNLVNQKGHEKPVKDAYERALAQIEMPEVAYQYFDFHNECKHMRWDRISVLIEKMEGDLANKGFFHLSSNQPEPSRRQLGVVRTNCMDNLDRTNVVQAALAKWTLTLQLRRLGIITESEGVDDFEGFSRDFREIWSDHADSISKAYAGSGALKVDFTRTNKRTRKGLLEDGYKSIQRYIKNNYFDGTRQDAFDLVTGAWLPRTTFTTASSIVGDHRSLIIRSVPYILGFALFMITAGMTLPRTSDYSLFYYFTLWFSVAIIALSFMVINGIQYVAWPRLLPPTELIYYDGPGFRSAHHGKGFASAKKVPMADSFATGGRKRGLTVSRIELELGDKKRQD